MTEKKTKAPKEKREKKKLKWSWKKFFLILICTVVLVGIVGAAVGGYVIYDMASGSPEVHIENFESPESSLKRGGAADQQTEGDAAGPAGQGGADPEAAAGGERLPQRPRLTCC